MTNVERIEIPKPRGYNCFACGTANPIGLHLEFFQSGNSVCTEITIGKNHAGWENISHGGIISTLLDEVMSWTILYFKRVFFLTRKMEVKYIKPVLIGTPLLVKGSLIEHSESGNSIKVLAEIRDDTGALLAKGSGEFIQIKKEDLPHVFDGSNREILAMIEQLPPLTKSSG
jgi:acyl-coenzyme A thioesterase PaaI-like protein